ncbi:MAG: hypothetical protein IJX87_06705 [Clostridia bacterium]|nr:hypothetical protein [Clostridia bacterium]
MGAKKAEEKINDALLKVALGYQVAEVTEEYAEVDGALKLTKRKKTKKDIPPDLKAVQLLLAGENTENFSDWSDEELEKERARLLDSLKQSVREETKALKAEIKQEKVLNAGGSDGEDAIVDKSETLKPKRRKSVRKTAKKTVKKSIKKTGKE